MSDDQVLADWVACLALDPDLTIAPLLGVETVEPIIDDAGFTCYGSSEEHWLMAYVTVGGQRIWFCGHTEPADAPLVGIVPPVNEVPDADSGAPGTDPLER